VANRHSLIIVLSFNGRGWGWAREDVNVPRADSTVPQADATRTGH
jgi:hypothetical protein